MNKWTIQFQHYAQLMLHKNFGPRLMGPDCEPQNYRVERITAPIFMSYSTSDLIADINDVKRLIPMLSGSADLCLHEIEGFNHLDFVQSVNAQKIIYKNLLSFFVKCTCETNSEVSCAI